MASYYVRKGSPFYWVRFQKPDGTWGSKSSGVRRDGPGAARKIKQHVAEHTMKETHMDGHSNANRFDLWVPGFLNERYQNPKTVTRYMNAWSALATYLEFKQVISPAQITYQLCVDYPDFRTNPPKKLMRPRSHNTALTELKVFSAIMQEALRRGYVTANACTRLGLKRKPAKVKSEITAEEQKAIEEALEKADPWMRDCWLVAMRQGCRLSETGTPMRNVDLKGREIVFNAKGGRVHAAPLHDDLLPLVAKAIRDKWATLVQLPKYPAKLWHTFFRKLGMGHLSFHSTRVTVVTRLARSGAPIYQTKAYVGHASDTVHAIYQRLAPVDVRHLGAALSNPSAGTKGSP
jgi:integrase